jgi:hypothetical protein
MEIDQMIAWSGMAARHMKDFSLRSLTVFIIYLGIGASTVGAQGPVRREALVVWLIPSEPATPEAGIGGVSDCETEVRSGGTLPDQIEEEIDLFNAARSRTRVTVINTQQPFKTQLIDWSPEMAVPNWVWVKSQTETIQALGRFADRHQVNVRVRFITWDRALADLKATWEGRSAYEAPDVVQIGSTWTGYFQARNLLLTKPSWQVTRNGWEDVESARACVLPYVNDARLIFYWKRLPGAPMTSSAFTLHTGSWQAIVNSLRTPHEGGPPFAFPIGLTLNLLHDYASLVWAGGGDLLPETFPLGRHLDLSSRSAVSVPNYLAESSVIIENGRPRRLIAFPEASHEEVSRSFVKGLYRAAMEPANFIGRWKRDFTCRYSSQAGSFWNYAAAAVPPSPFRGGSYLAVWAQTSLPAMSFDLAEFLTEDEQYTHMLGISGYLPARRPGGGVDLFLSAGDGDVNGGAGEFASAVQQVLSPKVGRSYPPIRDFSTVLESREMLERLQIAWRRISERDLASLQVALRDAEQYANREIYPPTRLYSAFADVLGFVSAGLASLLLLLFLLFLVNRHRLAALRHVAQVRGFSAAGSLLIETVHGIFHNPVALPGVGPAAAMKSAMMIAALQGWRRGRDARNWTATSLANVIWRSIVLALDSTISLGVFREWEDSRRPALEFLQDWINEPRRARAGTLLVLDVAYPPARMQPLPFMLEQALVCLLQNAMKIVLSSDFDPDMEQRISIRVEGETLIVTNPGPPLSHGLCDAINQSRSPEEFEERISALLRTESETRPGFGLIEAYCILSQCFGGLRVNYDMPRFEVDLRQRTDRARRWGFIKQWRAEATVAFVIEAQEKRKNAEVQ